MFTDPQTVTVSTVAQTLPRTSAGVNAGEFRKDDSTYQLQISHQYGKRTRRTVRLNHNKVAADPFTADNVLYSMSAYLVIDIPKAGYTVSEAKAIADGLLKYLTDTGGSKVTQLLGGEM